MDSGALAPLCDAHVHLPAYPEPGEVVAGARRRGMRLVSVGVSPAEAAPNLRLRDESPEAVKCFIGVHPSEAASTPNGLDVLSPLWEAADGVGEIGLDPKYSEVSSGSAQMELFKAQVEVAARLKKPLQVHSRGAEGTCLDVLDGYSLGPVLMHWFEGEELLERVLSRPRTFVSFGPAILYSKKLLRMARRCPPEAVLTRATGRWPSPLWEGLEGPGWCPAWRSGSPSCGERASTRRSLQLSLNEKSYLG